ncbi:hypothetical protein RHGRI_024307 [Rhododendron griersonianum]|uniref:Large ribosomal subunit protein uL29m n=1 Tax=Rhododendron griersonianum TaxID=479676 RepID=A0AAV6J7Y3_9ERIC|nr:hypothetical protein RHGRI_024307 [Rhododendron griersonianum]
MLLSRVFARTLFTAAKPQTSAAAASTARSGYNPLEEFFEADRSPDDDKPVVYVTETEGKRRADQLAQQLEDNGRKMEGLRKEMLEFASSRILVEAPVDPPDICMNFESAKMKLLQEQLKFKKKQLKHAIKRYLCAVEVTIVAKNFIIMSHTTVFQIEDDGWQDGSETRYKAERSNQLIFDPVKKLIIANGYNEQRLHIIDEASNSSIVSNLLPDRRAAQKKGRSWKASELRVKSWDDLHKLWCVLMKEKNLLMTQRQMLHSQNLRFSNPERIPKVRKSMCRIKQVLTERAIEDPDSRRSSEMKRMINAL